ncbi:MAG: hypothetical protein MUP76_04000, partial [Acidimicrobiia bacterium]|nr:hypothetical protein [Acidimicrobiia bacterium]
MSGNRPHNHPQKPGIDPEQWESFVRDVRKMTQAPSTETAADHISAAAEAARTAPVIGPAAVRSTVPRSRRRTVFASLISTLIGKILIGSMAVAAATAGVGAAGALPDPVQDFVDDHVFQREHLGTQQLDQIRVHTNEITDFIVQNRDQIREQFGTEEPAGGPAQTQTQQGPGEEGPTQTQTQQGPGECVEEPCGTQTQTQTQQGPGECVEEPCGTQTQTQTQQG